MDQPKKIEDKKCIFLDFGKFAIQVPGEIFYHVAEFLSFSDIMRLKQLNKACEKFWHEEIRELSFDEATFILTHYAEEDNKEKFDYFWEKNESERRLRAVRLRCLSNTVSLKTIMEIYKDGCFIPRCRQEKILKDDFAQALRVQDIDYMKTMFIGARFPLFSKNRRGKTHIALICKIKSFSLFKLFLDGEDRVNEMDEWDISVLHYVIKYGTIEMVKYLVENNVKINVNDYKGDYPLHYAAMLGKTSIVDLLCKCEAEVNVVNAKKETPLHGAARFGSYKSIEILLNQKNINKEPRDNLRQTPLHIAARCGNFRSTKTLIKSGAKLECRDSIMRTPLHNACIKGKVAIVELLLTNGANTKVRDLYGDTPMGLLRSVKNKKGEDQFLLRQLLLAHGAELATVEDNHKMVTTID
jgi:ankyrin repeat protein